MFDFILLIVYNGLKIFFVYKTFRDMFAKFQENVLKL